MNAHGIKVECNVRFVVVLSSRQTKGQDVVTICFHKVVLMCVCAVTHDGRVHDLKRSHALLQSTPVDDGPRLEEGELRAKALLLLLHLHERRLAGQHAVDGLDWRRAVGGE